MLLCHAHVRKDTRLSPRTLYHIHICVPGESGSKAILLRDLSTLSRADHLQISTGRDYRLISYLMPMALDWHSDVQRNANSNFVQKTCGLLDPKFLEDLVL